MSAMNRQVHSVSCPLAGAKRVTRIKFLVVIAILVILAARVFPALAGAKAAAQAMTGRKSLRQPGLALVM